MIKTRIKYRIVIAIGIIITACAPLSIHAQHLIIQQFDSLKAVLHADNFDDNWKPVISFLEKKKKECLSSDNLFIKSSFLDYYAGALYNDNQFAKCIPYVKQYIDMIEKDGWGDKCCEFLDSYYSLADCYFHLHQINEAEKTLRHAIIYYSDQLDSCVTGFAVYALL